MLRPIRAKSRSLSRGGQIEDAGRATPCSVKGSSLLLLKLDAHIGIVKAKDYPSAFEVAQRAGELDLALMEVLRELALGKSNRQIAKALRVTEGTVKIHLATIFRLLNVNRLKPCWWREDASFTPSEDPRSLSELKEVYRPHASPGRTPPSDPVLLQPHPA